VAFVPLSQPRTVAPCEPQQLYNRLDQFPDRPKPVFSFVRLGALFYSPVDFTDASDRCKSGASVKSTGE